MYDVGIVNGWIVDEDLIYKANVLIKDGKIATITEENVDKGMVNSVVDCRGKYLFPGAVDLHSHLGNMDGAEEDPDHASAAAAVGGITTCVDMPNNSPKPITTGALFEKKKEGLEERVHTDFCMWGALIHDNQSELAGLDRAGAVGFKSFLAPSGVLFTTPDMWELRAALREIRQFDGLATFHCEEYSIIDHESRRVREMNKDGRRDFLESRPLTAERVAVQNVIEAARDTGARVHICHASDPSILQYVNRAGAEGVDISAETCTHYLTFSENDFLEKGCLYKCAPPLRRPEARQGLWELLEKGQLKYVATDHSAGLPEERQDDTQPSYAAGDGISGIQTMMQVLFSEAVVKRGLSPSVVSALTSSHPAKRIQIYGQKGAVKVGFDADIVVIDPDREWEIRNEDLLYKQKISGFAGMSGKGMPIMTFIRGTLVAKDGKIVDEQFRGTLVRRSALKK